MSITNGAHDPSARCAGTSPSRVPRRGGKVIPQELSTSRGTAPLSFSALPRPESDGFVMK